MRCRNLSAVTAAALTVVLLSSNLATAKGFTETRRTVTLSALSGVPLALAPSQNPWTAGVGLRGGVTLRGGSYFGLAAQSFAFDTGQERLDGHGSTIEGRLGSVTLEAGRDFELASPLTLRLSVELGAGFGRIRFCEPTGTKAQTPAITCRRDSSPHAWLGAGPQLMWRFSRIFYLAIGGRWILDKRFYDRTTGAVGELGVGVRF